MTSILSNLQFDLYFQARFDRNLREFLRDILLSHMKHVITSSRDILNRLFCDFIYHNPYVQRFIAQIKRENVYDNYAKISRGKLLIQHQHLIKMYYGAQRCH